jgi:hypothetical protein
MSRDLAFTAKVRGTAEALGYRMRVTSDVSLARIQLQKWRPRVVFIDLTAGDLVGPSALRGYQQIVGPATWFVAAGPHVEARVLAQAKEAGCHDVMPRSRFSAELPELMRRYFSQPANRPESSEPQA